MKSSPIPEIKYKFPPNSNENPFDIKSSGKYFVSGHLHPTFMFDSLEQLDLGKMPIPMGYTGLVVQQRVAVVMAGKVEMRWTIDNAENIRFNLTSSIPKRRQKWGWDNLENALDDAINYSLEEDKPIIIVSKIINVINWH